MSDRLLICFVPLEPPKPGRGRPRREGRKVAAHLASAARRPEGANKALEHAADVLDFATGREVRRSAKGAPSILRDGVDLVSDDLGLWFPQSAKFEWSAESLTITGPVWRWERGTLEAVFHPLARIVCTFPAGDLASLRRAIPFG